MTAAGGLVGVIAGEGYRGQIRHVERLAARDAVWAPLPDGLSSAVVEALAGLGISRLYRHQAEAITAALGGEHVVVSTATASGKTLCYNAPVFEALVRQRDARALYLFPTKALAQDQLRTVRKLASAGLRGVTVGSYDGDTAPAERAALRKSANILLTNPDMLSLAMLPNHDSWATFFKKLRYVVIDEAHVYRGVFGSHVANVLRRLRRICASYGNAPQFILSSATLGNARQHAEALTGVPVRLVESDGAPRGPRDFVFWDPPLAEGGKGQRSSSNAEAMHLMVSLVRAGVRSLVFTRTRRMAELIFSYARDELGDDPAAGRIAAYRAGYLAEARREIERRLFDGELLAVTATNALELGVDIGGLDAVVLTGYPGSNASTWQQAGRAGRGNEPSLAVLVALDNPLDEYLMEHPDLFFSGRVEHALINPANPYILASHLVAAAYELPLAPRDDAYFAPDWVELVAELEAGGLLRERGGRWFPSAQITYPAQQLNIRSSGGEPYLLIDASAGNRVLETVSPETAFQELHPGAVHLHQGESYVIKQLDLKSKIAVAEREDVQHYTITRDTTMLGIVSERATRECGRSTVHWGEVDVTTSVVSFMRKRQYSDEVLSEEPLELPERQFRTVAVWYDIPPAVTGSIQAAGLDVPGALHAAEHASIGLLPLFALCDRRDIGGLSTNLHPDTGRPQVFIYDGHAGGVGIAEHGYGAMEQLWEATLDLLEQCPCDDGCPRCVQSPKCGNNNDTLDKAGARLLLGELTGRAPRI